MYCVGLDGQMDIDMDKWWIGLSLNHCFSMITHFDLLSHLINNGDMRTAHLVAK